MKIACEFFISFGGNQNYTDDLNLLQSKNWKENFSASHTKKIPLYKSVPIQIRKYMSDYCMIYCHIYLYIHSCVCVLKV